MSKTLKPFNWFGCKAEIADWIINRLIATDTYVEPFGGSATILLNREPRYIEVYNDLDGRLGAFFRTLRDNPEDLRRELELTPYSREEFVDAVDTNLTEGELTDLECARRFYVRTGQKRHGRPIDCDSSDWSYAKTPGSGRARRNINRKVSRWWSHIDTLPEIADRMREVQIENKPATDVIERYDTQDTLFYCDPPYPHEVRGSQDSYGSFESSDSLHHDLADALSEIDGYAAVSGYQCDLYDCLFGDWYEHSAGVRNLSQSSNGSTTVKECEEMLWTNYDPKEHRDFNDWRRRDDEASLSRWSDGE